MGQINTHKGLGWRNGRERAERQDGGFKLAAILGLFLACGAVSAQAKPAAVFDNSRAWEHLVKQVSFGPRVPMTKGHQQCADYILAEMRKHCQNVRTQEFTHKWSQTGKPVKMMNLIGEQNWEQAEVRVLLLAHWDTRPTANQEIDPKRARQPILGANDGASGVAVLLELMRVMKERQPKVGIMYLFTDGEDLGPSLDEMFLGAKHFAASLPKPRPDYGILLDMIGDKNLEVPIEPNSYSAAPALVKALYLHARSIGLASTFPNVMGTPIQDDHLPLIDAGIPTVDLIDFDYDPWHTLEDTVDKCSPESLGKVGHLLETWLLKPRPWRPS